jgi:hypothetical protein
MWRLQHQMERRKSETQKRTYKPTAAISLFLFGTIVIWGFHLFGQELESAYDHESGEYWQWHQDSSGRKISRGWNYKTGSHFSSTIKLNT